MWAQATTGEIWGTVLNEATGNYLNNARVVVEGTKLEAYTNEGGEYRLRNVPVGEVILAVHFLGMDGQSVRVRLRDGEVLAHDFTIRPSSVLPALEEKVVELAAYEVKGEALSGQAIARTEQRNAANIKSVITPEGFADIAGGNLGEYIKFVPGVDVVYDPFDPTAVSLRGMAANSTLVQFDGVTSAGLYGVASRSFDLNTAANANIERIEVAKAPTPDMPANAIGGSINVVSKRGFSRKAPLFTYNVYSSYSALPGEFRPSVGKAAGVDPQTDRQPAPINYELTYIYPINRQLAVTLSFGDTNNIYEGEYISPTWDVNSGMITSQVLNEYVYANRQQAGRATVDWRISKNSTVQLTYYGTNRETLTRANWLRYVLSSSGRTGDAYFVQGRGNARQYLEANNIYRDLQTLSLGYKYSGRRWKFDMTLAGSRGVLEYKDDADGLFHSANTIRTPVRLRVEGLDGIYRGRVPVISATTDAGALIPDPFDANTHTLTTVTTESRGYATDVESVAANLEREFDWVVPSKIRIGFNTEKTTRDARGGVKTWAFSPPGGDPAKVIGNYDLIAEGFSDRMFLTDVSEQSVGTRYFSLHKAYQLYQRNPSWFVLNQVEAHMNEVNASQQLDETISAVYLRLDNKFFNNRLWLVSGVRFEHTQDSGMGPKVDANAIYQRNPDGSFVMVGGARVPLTTDPLAQANLIYVERGLAKETSYSGYYPSVNLSYALGDSFVLRASYARTIRRPELSAIIPNITISDPESTATGSRTITLVDGSLRPQNSDNFNLSLEAYEWKGATASIGVFQNNLFDSFTRLIDDVDEEWLARLGLPQYYMDEGYQISRVVNAGTARVMGLEASYRQNLSFIPRVGENLQLFGSYTKIDTAGEQAATLIGYSREQLTGGLSFVTKRFVFKVNATYRDWKRLSLSASGIPTMVGPSTKVDISSQYSLNKRLSLFCSIRNVTSEPEKRYVLDASKPEYTWPREFRHIGVGYRVGIKGNF